jgi:uncharacterized membrane protein YdjX (TVP38/TMEM64 family)
MSRPSRWVTIAVLAVMVGLLWWQGWAPDVARAAEGLAWLRRGGPEATALFVGLYLLGTLAMAPASWLQGTAGFLYGPVVGVVVASLLSTFGGTLSFLLARRALRRPLLARFGGRRLAALDGAVAEGGTSLVALLRLSPVSPYNVVNYMLGLTQVPLRSYVIGSWAGSLVPVTLYVYVGSTVGDLSALLSGEAQQPSWVRWVGLGLTVVVTLGVTRFAKTTLQRHLSEDGAL